MDQQAMISRLEEQARQYRNSIDFLKKDVLYYPVQNDIDSWEELLTNVEEQIYYLRHGDGSGL